MNPNSPLSHYQIGAVTVTNGSKVVKGYKTEWVSTHHKNKPVVGSTFTIDQSRFYKVKSIDDDTTITLTETYEGPNNTNSSYLLIKDANFDESGKSPSGNVSTAIGASASNSIEIGSIKEAIKKIVKKLGGIESNAKDDQNASEVPTNQVAHKDLPDNVQKALDALWGRPAGGADKTVIDQITNNIKNITNKLKGIESNAKDDQDASEVPTNQTTNKDMPDNVQKTLDALWGRKSGSSSSSSPAPLSLGTWSKTDLQDDGGFSQVGGKTFKIYAYNDDGAKTLSSLEKLFPKYDWIWAYAQKDKLFPFEMFPLSAISYDSNAEVLSITTDSYTNWQGGAISMFLLPLPKAKGASSNSDATPIGTYALIDNYGKTPKGYMYCGGAAVSRAANSELFAKIGTKYGAGDGSTTFNLPTQDFLPEASYGHRVEHGYDKGEKVSGIAINSRTKDVYVIGKPLGSQDWDVFKQTGGVGPWVSEGYNVGRQPFDIAVNESNGDLWVADSFLATEVYKKSGGGSKWEPQHYSRDGGKYAFSIALNQSNGDVWVADQNAGEVFKLPSGSSHWKSKGYNAVNGSDNAVPTGIDIDYSNGDVYVVDKTMGRISILRGGSGAWESEDTTKIDSAAVYVAVNPKTKDIFIMRNADAVLYVQRNGIGKLDVVQKNDGNMDSPGMAIDYLTGDIYFSAKEQIPKAGKVYKYFGVPQWFIKTVTN